MAFDKLNFESKNKNTGICGFTITVTAKRLFLCFALAHSMIIYSPPGI
jgi:hypothetical protein